MIIEHEESVTLEEGAYLADTLVGGLWSELRNAIPANQAKELDESFNLIMLSQPESLMPSQLTDLLINEALDIPAKKHQVYLILTTNIIDVLEQLGFVFNHDFLGEDNLPALTRLLSFFMELQEYEDLIGLKHVLEAYDIPPVNRLFLVMQLYLGEDLDLSEYETFIEDVSEVTLKAIKDALFNPEEIENVPTPIEQRIRANATLIEGTLAFEHVKKNGQLGGSVKSFLSFYRRNLEVLLAQQTEDSTLQYAKEIIGFFLVSEINNEWLKDKMTQYLYSVIEDPLTLTRIEDLIQRVELP